MTNRVRGPLYWIAGYPGSGGDWARSFLAHLLVEIEALEPQMASRENLMAVSPWDVAGPLYKQVHKMTPDEVPQDKLGDARLKVHEYLAQGVTNAVFVKTHAANGTFFDAPTFHPKLTGGTAYFVRHPFEVALVLSKQLRVPLKAIIQRMALGNYVTARNEKFAPEPVGSWSQNVESWTQRSGPDVLVIKYEDMRDDPLKIFSQLVNHIGILASVEKIEAAVEKSMSHNPDHLLQDNVSSAISPIYAHALLQVHARQMNRFGYLTKKILAHGQIDKAAALKSSMQNKKLAEGRPA